MSSQFRISFIYLVFSTLWILFSDSIVITIFGTHPELVYAIQTIKGWLFITLTALLLYLLIRREFAIRHRVEDTLRQSEARFRDLFMNNPQPMWIYDPKTLAFLDVNETAVLRYGYSRDEFLRMTLKDIRPSEDIDRLLRDIASAHPQLQSSGQWRHRLKNGQVIQVEITSHLVMHEGQQAALVVAHDVTKLIQTNRELQRTTGMLQSLIAASPLAIHMVDLEARVTLWNPASEEIFGWTEAEVKNRPLPTIPPGEVIETQQLRQRVLSGETVTGLEVRRICKDGTCIDASLSLAPLYNDENDPTRITEMMGVLQNITEHKHFQVDREEKAHLQTKLNHEIELRKLRNRFISLFSHEFRNPLAAISTSVEFLQRYNDRMSPTDRVGRIERINDHIKQLVTMLNDVVAVMKNETTVFEFNPQPLRLNELMQGVITDVYQRHKQALDVQLHCPEPIPMVEADVKLLRYALDNIINNAVKYSPQGGRIDIRIQPGDETLQITVQDHGIGIPEEDLPHLFETFARGKNVGDIPGTGLGLVIVRQAMELHSGTVTVTSKEGTGTTFTLSLPLKQPDFEVNR